ncbi:DMT family transporter [Bacillus alkalicellulosilyticus]|uniref:DMT family transporter n=1 Tax=Alkalihalobacterium alkalicellulosilyticum TaxID=1912214 RepID=UPI000996B369|nr:DMT family transporter [Bacillus alkalicellulosilyticus]
MGVRKVAFLKVIIAMCIVGSSVVAGKVMVDHIPIFIASALRFILASIIFVPLLLWKEGLPSITRREWGILILQSVTGVFLFSILMLYGLTYTSAVEAGIITSTLPAMVAILAIIMLREKLTTFQSSGVILAVTGVFVLHLFGSIQGDEVSSIVGNVLIVGAVLGEALFIILGKSLSSRLSPLAISTSVSLIGGILFMPLAIYEIQKTQYDFTSSTDWALILYFAVIVTVLAFLLMYEGLAKLPASAVGVLTSVLPLSTVLLSVLLLKEPFLLHHLFGLAIILVAIYFISREDKHHYKQKYPNISRKRI